MKRFAWMALGALMVVATEALVLHANNNAFNFVLHSKLVAIYEKACEIQESLVVENGQGPLL